MFRLAKKRGGASYKIQNPLEPKKNVTALFDTESAANQFIMTEGLKGYKPEEVYSIQFEAIPDPCLIRKEIMAEEEAESRYPKSFSQLDKGAA